MNHKKSLLSKLVVSMGLPITVIFVIVAGLVMSNASPDNLPLIFAVGLLAILGVFVLAVKGISNKLSKLTQAAS